MAAAANGINADEHTNGVAAVVSLAGTTAIAGDTVELLVGGDPFATPVTQVLTAANITANNVTVDIPGGADWGGDGGKALTARVIDAAGNASSGGGALTVTLGTTPTVITTDVVSIVGVADMAGNTATIGFMIP